MGVYIGGIPNIITSQIQGPCPSGFHVPTIYEWTRVINILREMNLDSNTGYMYLKLPNAGYRNYAGNAFPSTSVANNGGYWSCTPKYDNPYNAYNLRRTNAGGGRYNSGRCLGLYIRPFKDTPVVPDSSRTNIISITKGKIAWDQTNGLISLGNSRGNWITIADKNLGATVVYSHTDTKSQANCGNLFQWGNNNPFPRDGTITTSTTKVDASSYGPGNYYTSSTFIRGATSSMAYWDSSNNPNLWGGVTGALPSELGAGSWGTSPIKGIYKGDTKVRPEIPPYLAFERSNPYTMTIVYIRKIGNPTSVIIECSLDGENWDTFPIGNGRIVPQSGKLYFRNASSTDTGFSTGSGDYYRFEITGQVKVSGELGYLLNKNNTTALTGNYCFYNLFSSCSSLETAPILNATTMKQYCYSNMFYHCTSLKEAPVLPATTLDQYCYANMFEGCTALETCPSLSVTTLAQGCYRQMFYGCSSLTTLPQLPATTVPTYGYNGMFNYCSKIKLSTTQVDDYQTAYRIPTTGSGSFGLFSVTSMFSNTGGTFTGAPSSNTTYYTSNVLV